MTAVEAIEFQIEKLSVNELDELRRWFMSFDSDAWDAKIEEDARSGRLNALADETIE